MPKKLFTILACFTLFSCKHKSDENSYQVFINEWHWATIDLKSGVMKVDFGGLKYSDTLNFTPSQHEELSEAFNQSDLVNARGEVHYSPNLVVTMPSSDQTITVYKDNKLITNTIINTQCKADFFPFGATYRAIHFRDVIDGILKNNQKFKQAQKRYIKYQHDNHIFFL